MKVKAFCLGFLAVLLLLAPFASQFAFKASAQTTDVMEKAFIKWFSWTSRWIGSDAVVYEHYDFAGYERYTLSGVGYTLFGLIAMYEGTGKPFYKNVLKAYVDAAIENRSGLFYKYTSQHGWMFYPHSYYWPSDGLEHDHTVKGPAAFATAAVKLYQWTGEQKYADLAHRFASETLLWRFVDNETDIAYSPQYFASSGNNIHVGVNRQTSVAAFYALYGKVFGNTSLLQDIEKILHWAWRAKLSNGGLGYSIGDTSASDAYTAFTVWHALMAYKYAPEYFSQGLKNDITDSLNYLLTISGHTYYLKAYITAAAMVLAEQLNFNGWSSGGAALKLASFCVKHIDLALAKQGFADESENRGFRWQQFFLGSFFACYPISGLTGEMQNQLIATETQHRFNILWLTADVSPLFLGDSYHNIGFSAYPYQVSVVSAGSPSTRSYDTTFCIKYSQVDGGNNITYWFYPDGTSYWKVTGTTEKFTIYIPKSAGPYWLRLSNGTKIDPASLPVGSVDLGFYFMLWRNQTIISRDTVFVWNSKSTTWTWTDYSTYWMLTLPSFSNGEISVSFYGRWAYDDENMHWNVLNYKRQYVVNNHPLSQDKWVAMLENAIETMWGEASWKPVYSEAMNPNRKVGLIALPDPNNMYISSVTFSQTDEKWQFNIYGNSSAPDAGLYLLAADEKPSYLLNVEYNLTANWRNGYLADDFTFDFPGTRSFSVSVKQLLLGMRYEAIANGVLASWSQNDALWRLSATVVGTDSKATVQIYTAGYRPRYVKVDGQYINEWTYNRNSKLLVFNVTTSTRNIEAGYGLTDEEVAGSSALAGSLAASSGFHNKIKAFKKRVEEKIGKTLTTVLFVLAVIIVVILIVYVLWLVFSVYVFPARD